MGFTHCTKCFIHRTKCLCGSIRLDEKIPRSHAELPRASSFHSLRDTTKGNNLCYPNEKQNTAVENWHLFSRSQATNLPFRTQRHYFKAWALMSHQCHKYCRVLLSHNSPFIYFTQCTKNCETRALLHPISRSACMVSGFLKILSEWLSRKPVSHLQPDVSSLMKR